MLKQYTRVIRWGMILADLLLLVISFGVAYFIRDSILAPWSRFVEVGPVTSYLRLLAAIILTWGCLLSVVDSRRYVLSQPYASLLWNLVKVQTYGASILIAFVYLVERGQVSRPLLVLFLGLSFLLLYVRRLATIALQYHYRGRGYNQRRALIVGTGEKAARYLTLTEQYPEWGLQVVGFVQEAPSEADDVLWKTRTRSVG